jgi:sugar phosphate isomerase/epimerase
MINFPQEDYSTLESIKATGGIVPDDCWQTNREMTFKSIELTRELGVKFLSLHFGFIDMENPQAADKLLDRVKVLADYATKKGVLLLMETGQETSQELAEFLEKVNHPALAVNFDPANMILYDKGDPIEAIMLLAPWIENIHIKDALRTKKPGSWGSEVPWGTGQVDSQRFLKTLRQIGFGGALAVEREAGNDRLGDIKNAVEKLRNFKG